jgi:hypothetical protein
MFPFHLAFHARKQEKVEKASCNIKTVSAADFPNRKQNFMHTLCSLLSAIIKIAQLPRRHLEKKPPQQ